MAESLYEGLLSLPLYPRMTDEDVEDVIAAVREIVFSHAAPVSAMESQRTVIERQEVHA